MHFHTFIIMAAFISLVGQCRGFTSRLRASRIGIAGNNNMAALRTNRYLSSSAIPKGNIGQDGDNIGQGQGEDDTWKTFSFGQFSTNVDTPNKKQRRMLQKAADIAKENEHYSDPMWDHLSDEEVEMGIAALSRYITPERKKRFDDVLQSRTSAVRIGKSKLRGHHSMLVVSYYMWGGALNSSDLLLSHPIIPLAPPMINILISTLKHTCL